MKKALLIGINYTGSDSELNGCHNDCTDIRDWLEPRGYSIKLLMDHDDYTPPTRNNILACIHDFVATVTSNDILYFHYSGHGTNIRDTSGDERDGMDECIYTLDQQLVTDDELYTALVSRLPAGARLCAVFDSCRSGSVLDLPWRVTGGSFYRENHNANESLVVSISGCRDTQTSADSSFKGRANGALTYSLLKTLARAQPATSWKDLTADINTRLTKYRQTSQLCCSQKKLVEESLFI